MIKGTTASTLSHDLVDLAILLATDKFFVLVCQLYLDPNLIFVSVDKRYLVDDHQGSFDCIIRTVDGERELFEAHVCARVDTDVGQHHPDIGA